MIDISIKADVKAAKKMLRGFQKQIPFAAAKALTDTVKAVQKAEQKQMPRKLDRPTPFTLKGISIKRATKRDLSARVFIRPIQAEYLRYQIEGGRRRARGRGLGVPTKHARLNQYGNIPGRRKGLVKKNQFIGEIRGILGVWERGHYSKRGKFSARGKSMATSVRLVIAFERSVEYKKRFPFYKIGEGVIKGTWRKYFNASIQHAIRTAR